jgi:hypothetical protein
MISTPISSKSDYHSGNDLEYDDDDVVKVAPQHQNYQSFIYNSSTSKIQQSIRLRKVVFN